MPLCLAEELSTQIIHAADEAMLHRTLRDATATLGFDHFAISVTRRPGSTGSSALLVHNYPDAWASVYITFDLAGQDPVRRACDRSVTGFEWSEIERIVPMTRGDRQMLAVGKDIGIADGYTIPRHLPGDASGSCSFAVRPERKLPRSMLLAAEIVGAFALASAMRIAGLARAPSLPTLSDRQRECLLWSARGKTSAESAAILDISEETVVQHLKVSRERYGVHCKQALILCALFDGLIAFGDIFSSWSG